MRKLPFIIVIAFLAIVFGYAMLAIPVTSTAATPIWHVHFLSIIVRAGDTPTSTPTPTNTPTVTPTPTATPTPTPTSTPVIFPTVIEPGTYLVNVEISPGLYRGGIGPGGCYWRRLNSSGDIIAADWSGGIRFYVEVLVSDYALLTTCSLTLNAPPEIFGDVLEAGDYLVNTEIQPGLYQGFSDDHCAAWRLSDFTRNPGTIIGQGFWDDGYYVNVENSDYGLSTNCRFTKQ